MTAPEPTLSDRILREALRADDALRPHVRETPLIPSSWLGREAGTTVLLKLETKQRTGAFKIRGALNKLRMVSEQDRVRGVVAASSGSHGIGVAEAGQILGIPVTVFVSESIEPSKLAKMTQRGAKVTTIAGDPLEAEKRARQYAAENARPYIPPYNDPIVIAGQATIGLELVRQCPTPPTAIFVPLGGGGLASGIAIATKSAWPGVRVIGCSPINSAVMIRSIEAGHVVDLPSLPTLSDGTAGGIEEDTVTFELCRTWLDEFVTVTEDEIRTAMRRTIHGDQVELEGAAAVAVAGYRQVRAQLSSSDSAVVVLSGANVSSETLATVLSSGG